MPGIREGDNDGRGGDGNDGGDGGGSSDDGLLFTAPLKTPVTMVVVVVVGMRWR